MKLIKKRTDDINSKRKEEITVIVEGTLEECKKELRDIVDNFDYNQNTIIEATSPNWSDLREFGITIVNGGILVIQKYTIE